MPKFLLYDGQGTVRQLTDSEGDILENQTHYYDAYGGRFDMWSDEPASNLRYTGQYWDESSQMYYLRARYYNPSNGLFNRVDDYSGNYSDPQSLHKYLYCHANPTNGIDPSGQFFSALSTFVANVIDKMMLGINIAMYWTMTSKVAAVLMGLLAITNLLLLATSQEALDMFIACNGGDMSQMSGIIAMDIWAIRNMLSTFRSAARNVITLTYKTGSVKDFWRKARQLQNAARNKSLVYVGDTSGMKNKAKVAQAAYRRALKGRLIGRFEAQGLSPAKAAEQAEEMIKNRHVDHIIDMQVSGTLKNPNLKSNLKMLDSSTNSSLGKQLQLEAKRLGLKPGDIIDDIIIEGPAE